MNKINLYKQIGVFVLMIASMFVLAFIDVEFYKAVMFLIGCYATGSTIGGLARSAWPLYEKSGK